MKMDAENPYAWLAGDYTEPNNGKSSWFKHINNNDINIYYVTCVSLTDDQQLNAYQLNIM